MSADPHNFDRRGTDPNVSALAVRVTVLEQRMERFDDALRQNTVELKSNTRLTEEIHGNTEDIIEAVKATKAFWEFASRWGKRFAIFAKYASYVVGLGVAVLTWLHLKK